MVRSETAESIEDVESSAILKYHKQCCEPTTRQTPKPECSKGPHSISFCCQVAFPNSLPLETNSTSRFPKGLFGPIFFIKFSTLKCAALSAIHGTFVHESHIWALLKMVYIRRQCSIYYQSFFATSTTPLIRFMFTSKHCVHEWFQKSFNTKNASHAFPPHSALPTAQACNESALLPMHLVSLCLPTQIDSSLGSAKHQTHHHWAIYARCSC